MLQVIIIDGKFVIFDRTLSCNKQILIPKIPESGRG